MLALMNFFKKLFGGGAPAAAPGLVYYVRGHKCGAVSKVRINTSNELSRTDDDQGYFVRKVVVDDKCYGSVEIELTFDLNHKEIAREVRGGVIIDQASYEAELKK